MDGEIPDGWEMPKGYVPVVPVCDAVMIQISGGKPVVTLMLKGEDSRPELEELARKILTLLQA